MLFNVLQNDSGVLFHIVHGNIAGFSLEKGDNN
jgi:hypothetical protein